MAMEEATLVQVNGTADHSIGDATPQLEGEQLRQALLKQLEYYFSRENLEKDDFLKSQMNTEFFVPIHVIAAFKMVRNLTTDANLIVDVLRSSKEVVVSEAGDSVRPQIKTQRSTLILRDISSETPQAEIEQIFNNKGCAPVKHIKPEIGNTWFVTFETEQDAIQTLMVLRTLTFKDKPIQARVKSENPLKNLLAPVDSYVPSAPYFPQWNGYYDYPMDSSYQGNGKHPRSPSQNGRGPRAPRTPRPDQPNQAQNPGQTQPQQHREPGNRGNRENNREPRQDSRPEGKGESKPEHKTSEGRVEQRSSRSQENRAASGETSREAGSARKGNERSLPAPSKEGQEGYKPKAAGQGKRGVNGQVGGKTAPHQKSESQPRGKPRNVPLGPESFPPLPGAPAAKNQEINLVTLNYSAVAHAGADKITHERPSNRRNRSQENAEKKSSSAAKAEVATTSEEPEVASTPAEAKEKENESPEAKDEAEAGKGQPSNRSYAEILRAKAALKEQNATSAAAEEAAGEAASTSAPSASTSSSSSSSSSSQRNHESKKGGEASGQQRGNRPQNRRNPPRAEHKEGKNEVQVDSEGFQKPTRTSRPRQDRSERFKERQPRSRASEDSTPAAAHATPAPVEVAAPAHSE